MSVVPALRSQAPRSPRARRGRAPARAFLQIPLALCLIFATVTGAVAEEIEIRFDPPGKPKQVYVAGDFNNWNPEDIERRNVVTMCHNSPYIDRVALPQMKEIVEWYDVDGLFFDIVLQQYFERNWMNTLEAESWKKLSSAEAL